VNAAGLNVEETRDVAAISVAPGTEVRGNRVSFRFDRGVPILVNAAKELLANAS